MMVQPGIFSRTHVTMATLWAHTLPLPLPSCTVVPLASSLQVPLHTEGDSVSPTTDISNQRTHSPISTYPSPSAGLLPLALVLWEHIIQSENSLVQHQIYQIRHLYSQFCPCSLQMLQFLGLLTFSQKASTPKNWCPFSLITDPPSYTSTQNKTYCIIMKNKAMISPHLPLYLLQPVSAPHPRVFKTFSSSHPLRGLSPAAHREARTENLCLGGAGV